MPKNMKTNALGEIFEAHDVYDLTYTRTGFRIIVTGFKEGTKDSAYMEIFFPDVRGFRCLDEGDLITYWESEQFRTGHCLYKVIEGGWLENEVKGILSVTSSVGGCVEYLVATNDYCVCILANDEPLVRIYDDPYPLAK